MTESKSGLKKCLGYQESIALIAGTIIGSGIFKSPTSILKKIPCVWGSLSIWAGCGVFACLNSFAYLDLAVLYPKSGGEYFNIKSSLGSLWGFMYVWSTAFVAKPNALGIMTITAGDYLSEAMFAGKRELADKATLNTLSKLIAILIIWLIALFNLISPKLAAKVQVVSTYGKLIPLVLIIVAAGVLSPSIYFLDKFGIAGNDTHTRSVDSVNTVCYEKDVFNKTLALNCGECFNSDNGLLRNIALVFMAIYSGMWSYDGWNQLTFSYEEVKSPKIFTRAIFTACPLVTGLYLITIYAYMSVMSLEQMIGSKAVAISLWGMVDDLSPPGFGVWINWAFVQKYMGPVLIAVSCVGSSNGSMFAAARIYFCAARDRLFPQSMGFVTSQRKYPSPVVPIIFNAVLATLMLLPAGTDFEQLVDNFSVTAWLYYGLALVIVFKERVSRKNSDAKYFTPVWLSIFLAIISFTMIFVVVGSTIMSSDATGRTHYIIILAFMACGLPVYWFCYRERSIAGHKMTSYRRWYERVLGLNVNHFIQKVFYIIPTDDFYEKTE